MANTYVDYTAVASQTDYNFSFEYLRDEHVKVKVNGSEVTNFTIVTSPVQLIRFDTAPAASAAIKIYRDSRGDFSPLVDFVDGSILTENELDESYKHNLFIGQEASEGQGGEQLTKKGLEHYDAEGNKIINLFAPSDNTDAANKAYVDQTIDNAIALGGSPAIVSLGGYDVTATGSTTARSLADRFGDTLNVKDFLCDDGLPVAGDGSHDDTTGIQAAVSASSGKFLFFPRGTYIINSSITVPSGSIGLIGENSTLKTNQDGPTGSSLRLFNFSGSTSDILLDGLTCDGDRANRTQAYTDTGTVAGVSVCGPDARVNWFRASSTRSFTVRNCRFINMHGSAVDAQFVNHFVVDGCYFENIAGTACKANQCDSASFTNNKASEIGILPETFLLDGVSKTFSVDTGIHMQYGDAFYADGVGYVTAVNNHVRDVSRCAFVADTSTPNSHAKAIFSGNTIVNNHTRLRCGNPHGAIWLENTSTGIVKGNIIRQTLRDNNETAIRSIVIVGALGEDVEDFIVEGNNVVHEGYRTTVPVSDYILYLAAPVQGDNPVVQVRNNNFINLDTDSGQIAFIEAKTSAEGSLIISGNTMINRSTVSSASALTFYADTGNQWFKIIQIENNMFECDNTTGTTTGSCLSFRGASDFSNASLEISGNDFSRSLNNAVYVGSFEGDTFVFTGNRAATLDADLRQDRQAHITNNVFGSETATQITSIDHQGTNGTCFISNNSVYGKMRTRTVTGNPNRAMVFSGNTFYAESGNDPCLLIGGNNEDITISNNVFYATADNQELIRWAANATATSDRSFIVGNIFQGAGYSSVVSINYSAAITYSTNQVVADNRMNDSAEGGSNSPRNTNT